LEVALQRPRVGGVGEPLPQLRRVLDRQLVTSPGSQVRNRLGPQATVEVVVQQHLGQRAYDVLTQPLTTRHHASPSRCAVSGEKAGRQMATYSAPARSVL